jgi:hypothetical protein
VSEGTRTPDRLHAKQASDQGSRVLSIRTEDGALWLLTRWTSALAKAPDRVPRCPVPEPYTSPRARRRSLNLLSTDSTRSLRSYGPGMRKQSASRTSSRRIGPGRFTRPKSACATRL